MKNKLKPLIILALFVSATPLLSYADNSDDPPEIIPIADPHNPAKPKAPSRVRISAYRDGDVLVIRSTVNVWTCDTNKR